MSFYSPKNKNKLVYSLNGKAQHYLLAKELQYIKENDEERPLYLNDQLICCFQNEYHSSFSLNELKKNWDNLFENDNNPTWFERNGCYLRQSCLFYTLHGNRNNKKYGKKNNKKSNYFTLNIWKDDICQYGNRCSRTDKFIYGECNKLHYITLNDICNDNECGNCNKLHLPKRVCSMLFISIFFSDSY